MNVLVTGGAGYIGSHTCLELLAAGHAVTVVDDLSNSSMEALARVEELAGKKKVRFYEGNVLDKAVLTKIFEEAEQEQQGFDVVIHFAGLKAVGESVEQPLRYYHNNVTGTLVLCEVMAQHNCKSIIFSSSATVYGNPATVPITEDFPLSCTNPYGRTKLMVEEILTDINIADPEWKVCLLRYFNPVGAHQSGRIGEDPEGIPNNLMPYVAQVAAGRLAELSVFGDDYDTHDGTGVRDYIHVVDLAAGHVAALEQIVESDGVSVYNLGTGTGYSVLDMVNGFVKACGHEISYKIAPRRSGDVAIYLANPAKAQKELGWSARYDIEDMCRDTWHWQKNNPNGYK